MQWLKTNFIQLSIHRQLQFGIISVSSFVCMLVLSLIFIFSFILIHLLYSNLLTIIDIRENQQIAGIALSESMTISLISESSKNGIQWIRNLIENYNRNNDFLKVFKDFNTTKLVRPYDNKGYSDCNNDNPRMCIIYNNFNDSNNENFKNYTLILSTFLKLH